MPFMIQGLRLPFVKVSTTPKTGRTMVWHAGPWQYNARTGQHSLKLGKKVTYTSRTRKAKAAAKKAKALKRDAERQQWDEHFASRATGANPASPPAKRSTAKKAPAKKPGRVTYQGAGAALPARVQLAHNGATDPVRPAIGQRVAVCGARTRDGSPCSNTGRCPHHGRNQ